MSILVGADGSAQINLGGGLKYIANITSWNASIRRNLLRQTDLSDQAERRTAGLADWAGDFQFNLQFSDDDLVANSAWQLLNFIVSESGDALKVEVALTLQRQQLAPDFEIFQTTVAGVIQLEGTVVVEGVSLNCEDPERPVVAVAKWAADGPLSLVRK